MAEELITSKLKSLWNDWQLRLMVLLCLAMQALLILVGNRRKYNPRVWIRIVTWSAYLSSDSLATVTLGILSSKLGDVNEKSGKLDEESRLMAFWAPCLLLLLGGADNITAYALEDNELWLRHVLGVAVQTGVTTYIYFMAWSFSSLSLLSFLMIIIGVTKYGERTLVLWFASSEKRKDSMLASPDPSPNYPRFMEEYSLKKEEGYDVTADEIEEVQGKADEPCIEDATELVEAFSLIEKFKPLFVKLILSNDEREASLAVFKDITWEKAFKIIEIELGYMYDMLYSKAILMYSKWGFIRRLITLSITCTVLASFSIVEKPHYKKVDLAVTYLLLVVVIFLEVYSIVVLLSSDWTDVWLSKSGKSPSFRRAMTRLQLCKQPRWSNSVGQFSLLSFCTKERPLACSKMLELIKVREKPEKYHYTLHEKVPAGLKDLIFRQVLARYNNPQDGPLGQQKHISYVLEGYRSTRLKWSTEGPLDQIIITWHVASELCYYSDREDDIDETRPDVPYLPLGRLLSRYMFYLLVMYPSMLPSGIGQLRLRDTMAEATKFFQERQFNKGEETSIARKHKSTSNDRLQQFIKATKMLREVNTGLPPSKVKGGRSKSVLFDGCIVASTLYEIFGKQYNLKWEMVSYLWTEMLLYAAFHCEGDVHAQQLRRGGELITHVWLMTAHFGLTDHFQMTEGHAIAKLILR